MPLWEVRQPALNGMNENQVLLEYGEKGQGGLSL
jgi:hypothetical protein